MTMISRVLAQHHRQFDVSLATAGIWWRFSPRSHAPRGNAVRDAPRPWAGPKVATPSVDDGIPTRSVGTRVGRLLRVVVISEDSHDIARVRAFYEKHRGCPFVKFRIERNLR